jgi:tRNA pseudouridine38-40 synthase
VPYVSALVAYDGSAYRGFQYQANAASIQCELEAALDQVAERVGRIAGAGRTDAGVHASGQVISVHVSWRHDLAALQRAWNVHLPDAITVRRLVEVPEEFHPRYSALSRTYRYTVRQANAEGVARAPRRSPLTDRFALYVGAAAGDCSNAAGGAGVGRQPRLCHVWAVAARRKHSAHGLCR